MSGTGESEADPTGESGTTLIEALAVLTITALVSLIVFPNLEKGVLTLARRQTAALVTARLREVRADAIARDTPVAFITSSDGRAYGASTERLLPAPVGVTVKVEDPTREILFFGDGAASGGRVRVQADGDRFEILVTPLSGTIAMRGR